MNCKSLYLKYIPESSLPNVPTSAVQWMKKQPKRHGRTLHPGKKIILTRTKSQMSVNRLNRFKSKKKILLIYLFPYSNTQEHTLRQWGNEHKWLLTELSHHLTHTPNLHTRDNLIRNTWTFCTGNSHCGIHTSALNHWLQPDALTLGARPRRLITEKGSRSMTQDSGLSWS